MTELLAREKGLAVDMNAFNSKMQEQKNRARAASVIDASDWVEIRAIDKVNFVGYDKEETTAELSKYRQVSAKGKTYYQVVLNETPFYAESGGQVGDTGILDIGGEKINVIDTKKENDLTIHHTDKLPTNPQATIHAAINKEKRQRIACNHSATHLLHAALRKVLGDHVQQKGSLVDDKYLRFDFTHFSKLTNEEISQVENTVNQKIRENISLDEQRNVPIKEAKEMGATALFGEKYGDIVRMITFDKDFSIELCGGTHVAATGNIGFFKIKMEASIAAGIRRIEAITGSAAEKFVNKQLEELHKLNELLKHPKNILQSVNTLLKDNNQLKKQIAAFEQKNVQYLKEQLKAKMISFGNINFIGSIVELNSADAVKNLAFELRKENSNLIAILGAEIDQKALLTIILSDDLVKEKGLNAGNMIKEVSKSIQGGGGGQPFYATAGGKNPQGLPIAIEQVKELIANI